LVEIDVGVVPPEFPHDFGARDDLTRTLEQQSEEPERLGLQLDADTRPPQFPRLKIGFEYPETNDGSGGVLPHDGTPSAGTRPGEQALPVIHGDK
jgi:hypothetical protein